MEFTFGTDPEFMISRWDDLQSAIPMLPKKEHALTRNGSSFYYDNVLAVCEQDCWFCQHRSSGVALPPCSIGHKFDHAY